METIIYECPRCDYMTFWLFAFNSHVNKCRKLERKFSCENKLEAHKCHKCNSEILLRVEYKEHINSESRCVNSFGETSKKYCVGQKEYKEFSCELCSFKTFSNYLNKLHKLKVHCLARTINQGNVKNEEINDVVLSKCNLKKQIFHKRSDSEDIKPLLRCFQCSYSSKNKGNLKRHLLVHADPNRFKCEQCSYQTKKKGCLRNHNIDKHTDPNEIEWFKCGQCSYQGKFKERLERHKLYMHNQTERYKCEQCSFQAKKKRKLDKHVMRLHANSNHVKKFRCEQCFYQSKTEKELKDHIIYKHEDPNQLNWLYVHKIAKPRQEKI